MAREVVRENRRATRLNFRAEDKIRIVLEGLRVGISHPCSATPKASQMCQHLPRKVEWFSLVSSEDAGPIIPSVDLPDYGFDEASNRLSAILRRYS